MKRLSVIAVFSIALSGCVTPLDYLLVESDPPGATIKFEDGQSCTTPCPITVTYPASVTIAKAGYIATEQELITGQTGVLQVKLELAAPTTDVEATALPDL